MIRPRPGAVGLGKGKRQESAERKAANGADDKPTWLRKEVCPA
jgi:hypothetical protein